MVIANLPKCLTNKASMRAGGAMSESSWSYTVYRVEWAWVTAMTCKGKEAITITRQKVDGLEAIIDHSGRLKHS